MIFDSILTIFEDGHHARQYGVQFLNILAVYLSSQNHNNFFNIDKGLWRRLLEGCKQMCEYTGTGNGLRNNAIQCIVRILELGTEYSYLADVLVDFVPFVESLFAENVNSVSLDLLKIGFLLTKTVSKSWDTLQALIISLYFIPAVRQSPVRYVSV